MVQAKSRVNTGFFSPADLAQIKTRGMSPDEISSQIKRFRAGIPFVCLVKHCGVGSGIFRFSAQEQKKYEKIFTQKSRSKKVMKLVPASGAATRMFESLLAVYQSWDPLTDKSMRLLAGRDPHFKAAFEVMKKLKRFAFYPVLQKRMSQDGLNLETVLKKGSFRIVLKYLLTEQGLNFSESPKALIPFHRYGAISHTALAEHLEESLEYAKDKKGTAHIHFTVSEDVLPEFRKETENYSSVKKGDWNIRFSIQDPATDTIAVDEKNHPLREAGGKLIFRPAGHGALLGNLNSLKSDVVFIKNIDNVAHRRLQKSSIFYKKVLGGILLELQSEIFRYLKLIADGKFSEDDYEDAVKFIERWFVMTESNNTGRLPMARKKQIIVSKLNRPVRVCGVVKNAGEPGGGPFWVRRNGEPSPQIVESAQVNMADAGQKKIWKSATHFNPVDLVCGIKDYRGNPFDLFQFADADAGIITVKSKDGRLLKALELPGLWNGAMAGWNTVFVEVPAATFNPVKTVADLLRPAHQPA